MGAQQWACTREQLENALTGLTATGRTVGGVLNLNAESMAEAILAQLPEVPQPGLPPSAVDALARLGEAWARYPLLRLGQLIGNVHRFEQPERDTDPYYLGDEEFVGRIAALIEAMDEGVTA